MNIGNEIFTIKTPVKHQMKTTNLQTNVP